MTKVALPSTLGLLLAIGLHAAPAQAIPNTWVASNGSGSACTRAAPCAGFGVAHLQTDDGGEINCVDAGNFGNITINRSITIDCTGTFAEVTGGLLIETDNVVVTLRGLSFNDQGGTGTFGIRFTNGSALHIENCHIIGFRGTSLGHGISFAPAIGTSKLYVSNTLVANNGPAGAGGGGILIQPTGSASAQVVIDGVKVHNNTQGIRADGNATTGTIDLLVRDSAVSGSTLNGIVAINNGGGAVSAMVSRTESTNNLNGVLANGAGATLRISGSTLTRNGTGLRAVNGGSLISLQNNAVRNNGTNGTPSATETLN
jgi:hypothetical protein